MAWFKRKRGGVTTPTNEKKETPEGLWYKCPDCKHVMTSEDHIANLNVCEECGKHDRIGADVYFRLIFDDGKFKKFDENLVSADPLNFEDTKKYTDRVKATRQKTGLTDAIQNAYGKVNGNDLVVSAMDFAFIGGSMGSVVGEKIARGVDMAIKKKCPFMIISKSGGARMMEAGISLMQLAKTSGKLGVLAEHKLPYISFLTDPTTGGVTASYAMLGDINIAEPGALIGFAGPRVVKETIGKDLPEGFQTSEFVLDHGFLDFIVERKDLKEKLAQAIEMFKN